MTSLSSVAHRGHGGDNDSQCGFMFARTIAVVGWGGRVAHGKAMHVMDWIEMRRWWHTSLVKGTTMMATVGRLGFERARAREAGRESENGREQQCRLPLLPLLARPTGLTLASGHVRHAWPSSGRLRRARQADSNRLSGNLQAIFVPLLLLIRAELGKNQLLRIVELHALLENRL